MVSRPPNDSFDQIVVHYKYHNFQILFLYFWASSSYLFIHIFFFYFLMELLVLQEYRLAAFLSSMLFV